MLLQSLRDRDLPPFLVQVLLDLASLIFEEQQSLEVILKKIAATIISFMQVQKCTIFIVDEDCPVSTEMDFGFCKRTHLFLEGTF